ncbi:MAG: hypothetical protein L0Y64_04120 [Myxococcaceae bacterium]|nr:hypothetical protein [Myxococcaceae bacterium]
MGHFGVATVMVAVNLFLLTDAEHAAFRTALARRWMRDPVRARTTSG